METAVLDTSGLATISLSTLPARNNLISASYGGTSNFAASTSSPVTVTVTDSTWTTNPIMITVATPAPVRPGANAIALVEIAGSSGYSGTVNLICTLTTSPERAQHVPTCSLNPPILMIEAGTIAHSTLTIRTTAPKTTTAGTSPSGLNLWNIAGGSALAGLVTFCIPSRRRRRLAMLALLLVIVLVGNVGCGGGPSTPVETQPRTTTTTPGPYSFTVTGSDVSRPGITISTIVTIIVVK